MRCLRVHENVHHNTRQTYPVPVVISSCFASFRTGFRGAVSEIAWHVRFVLRAHQYKEAVMKRLMIGVLFVVLAANVSAQRRIGTGRQTPEPAAGEALAGLTAAQRADFADGLGDFTEVEKVTDGLGPVFNESSCAACHSVPATGGGSNRLVTRFATRVNGP